MPEARTHIDRLRVTGARLDPLLTRLRAERLLSAVDLRPAGLPPSAILCIRALPDPLPGSVSLDGQRVTPPAAWQGALQAAVSRIAAQAARPARGPVPADAGAVLFADYAEMLACLALDWCEGRLHSRWWWQVRMQEDTRPRGVVQTWFSSPEHGPAALQLLADRGAAGRFARSLLPGEARTMVQRIAGRFAAPGLVKSLADNFPPPAERPDQPDPPSGRSSGAILPPVPAAAPPRAPWAGLVPEAAATDLSAEQRCLLGVGLMLWRAPALARRARFAQAVGAWLAAEPWIDPGAAGSSELPPVTLAGDQSDSPSSLMEAGAPGSVEPGPVNPRPGRSDPRHPHVSGRWLGERVTLIDPPERVDGSPVSPREPQPPQPSVRDEQPGPSPAPLALPEDAQPAPQELLEAEIETAWGGLFYLVNVGLSLGLYGDFTTPEQPGIALPVWDFIALLGEQLAGGSVRSDPVWGLLASLSGRDPQSEPGAGYRPPRDFRLPPAWLSPFPEPGQWRWDVCKGRLRVRHPAGFWVLDVRARGDPARRLAREMKRYAAASPGDVRPARLRRAAYRDDTDRWAGLIAGYCRARLHRALGSRRAVFAQPARVMLTAGAVHVLFRLDDLPVEVRRAGLDRDPGWVPAAGRFILFRFD